MAKQRDLGNVTQLPSGRWRARYKVDGAWRNAPATFITKTGATNWLATQQSDLIRGTWRPDPTGKLTFGEHGEKWMSNQSHLRPRTVELYRYILRLHLVPTFGDRPLVSIKSDNVVAWYQALKAKRPGVAPKAYRLFAQLMQAALDDGQVKASPVAIKGAGHEPVGELTVPTRAEAMALADAVPTEYRAMVLIAAWCGLRFGELAALRREDIDLTARTVRVSETVTELLGKGAPMTTGAPKTEAGRRTIAIPSNIVPAITSRLETVTDPTALLFPAPRGGYLSRVHFRQRVWLPALKATGLSFRFHDLRHCALTLAAEAGATIAELMARGGHSSPATAMRYQHASAQRDQALAARMAALG
jgi:integrase